MGIVQSILRNALFVIVAVSVVLYGILMFQNLLNGEDPKNQAIAIGYFSAFFYTLLFGFILRDAIKKLFSRLSFVVAFTLIGTIGSVFLEFVIWLAQVSLKTTGAAISPVLFLDFLMTVPFYALLCFLFSKWVAKDYSMHWGVAALAGGFYEIIADGIIGNLFQLNIVGALISPVLLPIFIVTYSPIILVPFRILSPGLHTDKAIGIGNLRVLAKPSIAALIFPFSIGAGILVQSML